MGKLLKDLNTLEEIMSTQPGCGQECQPEREQKHLTLMHAIAQIDDVISHANDLLSTITGQDNPSPDTNKTLSEVKPVVPTLMRVLDDSPQEIRQRCSTIHDILNNIRSAII